MSFFADEVTRYFVNFMGRCIQCIIILIITLENDIEHRKFFRPWFFQLICVSSFFKARSGAPSLDRSRKEFTKRWYVTIVVNHGLQRRMGLLLRWARHSSRSRKQRARRVFFSQKTRKLFPLEIYVLCWTYWTIQLSPCRRYWYCSLMIPWWGKPWLEGRIIPKRIPWSFERGIRIEVQILRKWSNISGTVQPKFESLKFNTLRSNVKKF